MTRRLKQCPRWLVVALFVVGVNFLSQQVVPVESRGDLQLHRFVLDGGLRKHRRDGRGQLRRSVLR